MKKTICLLAVLLIACGLLAGCAPDSSSEETQEAPSGEIVESSPAVAFPAMEGIGSDPLNALNEGYAVLSGGALYYADRQNGGNIWRSDPDGGNAQMLAEGSFRNLNVSGGRIFFTGWSGIYSMPVDGEDGIIGISTTPGKPAALTGSEAADFPKACRQWYSVKGNTITGKTSDELDLSFEYVPAESSSN